jgi:hypothetical protein
MVRLVHSRILPSLTAESCPFRPVEGPSSARNSVQLAWYRLSMSLAIPSLMRYLGSIFYFGYLFVRMRAYGGRFRF